MSHESLQRIIGIYLFRSTFYRQSFRSVLFLEKCAYRNLGLFSERTNRVQKAIYLLIKRNWFFRINLIIIGIQVVPLIRFHFISLDSLTQVNKRHSVGSKITHDNHNRFEMMKLIHRETHNK